MGSRIARRFLDGAHEVVVWNRDAEKAEPLVAAGASRAATPAEAGRAADAVVVMVSDPSASRAVVDGPDGLEAAAAETTLIQMSTVGPAAILQLAPMFPQLLDAPVLGSLSEVEAGTLKVFVGGPDELVHRWTPLLETLGTVFPVGPVGAGSAAKLVANATLVGTIGLLGETLALADHLGLSRDEAFRVLAETPLAAQAERRRSALQSGEFPRRFALSLARKDADLILDAAPERVRMLRAAREWFADAEQAGRGDDDYSAVLSEILR